VRYEEDAVDGEGDAGSLLVLAVIDVKIVEEGLFFDSSDD